MSDYLIELTDAEVDLVSGGFVTQVNYSSISQSATATNTGLLGRLDIPRPGAPVSATAGAGGTAIAIGAAASNTALVSQANIFSRA